MLPVVDRLRTLKVSDVMARDVVGLAADQTMNEAAAQLRSTGLSSAPVVDDEGRCVGMLSAADYLSCSDGETRRVERYLTDVVRSAKPETSLLEASRIMCDAHVHHLPVLNDTKVVGIVSTMDIVAAVVNAVDELDSMSTQDF